MVRRELRVDHVAPPRTDRFLCATADTAAAEGQGGEDGCPADLEASLALAGKRGSARHVAVDIVAGVAIAARLDANSYVTPIEHHGDHEPASNIGDGIEQRRHFVACAAAKFRERCPVDPILAAIEQVSDEL